MAILYNFEIKLNQLYGGVGCFHGACSNRWVLMKSSSGRQGGGVRRVVWVLPLSAMGEQNKEIRPQNMLLEMTGLDRKCVKIIRENGMLKLTVTKY